MAKTVDQISFRPYLKGLCSFMECSPYYKLDTFPFKRLEGSEVVLSYSDRGSRFIDHKCLARYVSPSQVNTAEHSYTLIFVKEQIYKISVESFEKLLKDLEEYNATRF